MTVEYDLENSQKNHLVVKTSTRMEQSAVPCCLAWYPPLNKEHFMITANDQFKLKLYNSTTKMCRKTVQGPTYGSPLKKLLVVPRQGVAKEDGRYYGAFMTADMVGLLIFPVDGNPHNAMAVIAHPYGVSQMEVSHDGRYLFTAGGMDHTIHMWEINSIALEAQAKLGGEGLGPFYGMLEGGREGQLFADMENYFYYAQMMKQGPDSSETRAASAAMPLSGVPSVMRALGFYPTEHEIEDMLNEVKFSRYVETGQYVQELDIGNLIQLFVNHRPAFGTSMDRVQWAFDVLGVPSPSGSALSREDLLDFLQNRGEHLTENELVDCLDTLLEMGLESEGIMGQSRDPINPALASVLIDRLLPHHVTAPIFNYDILGLGTADQEQEEDKSPEPPFRSL